jgi:hypothetical protein
MSTNLLTAVGAEGLSSPIHGLHATPAAPLPFLRGVVVRSFVLERKGGNIIVYNAPGITAAASDILRLGRPDRLLINHCHEAMYGAPDLDVPMFVHEDDLRQTPLRIAGTFSAWTTIGDDLELIPTPGHTPGTTMFLWNNGEHRLLFPGDAIWIQGGEWKAVLLGDSDRKAYLASLSVIMDLDFDILVPWGSEKGQPCGHAVTRPEARRRLQSIIDRLKAGKNG